MNTKEFNAKFAKKQNDARRKFTVPGAQSVKQSLFCSMLLEGCACDCNNEDDNNQTHQSHPALADSSNLST